MKINGDLIGKIIVIVLVAVFLGLTLSENRKSNTKSSGFSAGAMSMGAGMSGIPGAGAMGMNGGIPGASGRSGGTGGTAGAAAAGAGTTSGTGATAEAGSATGTAGTRAGTGATAGTGSAGATAGAGAGNRTVAATSDAATNRAAAAASAAAAKTVTVNYKAIEPETIQKTVRVSGDIASKTELNAYPITSGKVTSILKKTGDTVTKGEIIAYIDPSKPGATYAASPVTAPLSGTIISMNASVGDNASAQQAFASIGTVKELTLTVYVSEKYSASLRKGLPAYVSVTSAPGETFEARITAISPVINKSNRTVEVTLELNKYDSRIKPGMYASVQLAVNEINNTFVVPKKALHVWNDKTIVYVIDDENVARRVVVETGMTNDFEAEIISGLSEGDRVVTAGSVADGTPVRIAVGN